MSNNMKNINNIHDLHLIKLFNNNTTFTDNQIQISMSVCVQIRYSDYKLFKYFPYYNNYVINLCCSFILLIIDVVCLFIN